MKKLLLALLAAAIVVVAYYYLPERKIPPEKNVDRIVISLKDHRMEAYSGNELLKTYSVSTAKRKEGLTEDDTRSIPSGEYFVFDLDARSKYFRSIGFTQDPSDTVTQTGKDKKKKKKKTGFRIHGMKRGYGFIGKFHRWTDWTKGGIAVTDDEIDDLFKHVETGASVVVRE